MKFLVVVVMATLAFSQIALAQTSKCRSLPDPGQRLACYDMAAPPATAVEKPSAKRAAGKKDLNNGADAGSAQAVSPEDAQMNAQMKNICRGC